MLKINFNPFPNLTADRINLRQLCIDDSNEILFLRSDGSVNKFLDREKANNVDDAINFIKKIENVIANNEGIYWAITNKNSNTLIGTICLFSIDTDKETAEIGYELNPGFQGKGIMQEAILTVIKYAFNNLKIKTLTACPRYDNAKSVSLLERTKFILDTNFTYCSKEELKDLTCYYLTQ